ncbi:hypothetical protein BT93_H2390 [Corymbia citriodora subsp. variegata]|nr:hypothetical protein BT93_H2390 [Corymbia citriodora subsp. variegata]
MPKTWGQNVILPNFLCNLGYGLADLVEHYARYLIIRSVSFPIGGRCFPSLKAPRFQVSCAAKKETMYKVCQIVRKQLALPDDATVTGESKFTNLGADSLDTVEIVMGSEEEFGISVEEESAQSIATVQEAADMIKKLIEKK